jgi:hypothetical protein
MIRVSIDQASLQNFQHGLELYKEQAGKTQREATIELARACAKELAIKIQPFGVSAKAGKRFEASIAKQVWRAVKNSQVQGSNQTIRQAHESRRDDRGQVPRDIQTRGKYRRSPYEADNVREYALKKGKNAGLLKGAWIAAGEKLTNKPITGVAKWVRRHSNKNGAARVAANDSTSTVYITNELDYIKKAQRDAYIQNALKTAYRKQYARMRIEANKKLYKTI